MPNFVAPITEQELRSALLEQLRMNDAAVVVEELGVEHGSARIDVACFAKTLSGYEIKSDFDTARRFSNQIHAFNRVFDEIYLVSSAAFTPSLKSLVPSWWGILEGQRTPSGAIVLKRTRAVHKNQSRDPISILTLLRRDELLLLATRLHEPKGVSRIDRSRLYELLANSFSLDEICQTVLDLLKVREGSTLHAQ